MDTPQQENGQIRNFLDRFQRLAVQKGGIVAACRFAEISRSLFYAVSDGSTPITPKLLAKLDRAESEAGSQPRDGPADPPPDCRRYPAEPPPVPVSVLGDITPSASLADELATIRHLLEMAMTRLEIIESKHRTSP